MSVSSGTPIMERSVMDRAPAWRRLLTASMVTALFVLAGVAACAEEKDPRATVGSLQAKSPTLKDKKRLRIGVRGEVPFLYYVDGKGTRSGFEIEIAKALAAELGFPEDRIDWVPIKILSERFSILQRNGADLVVANISMTRDREDLVNLAGPYLLVPQAVLVRRDRTRPLESINDLRAKGVRVCTVSSSTAERSLKAKGIRTQPVDTNVACMQGMKKGQFDAFSTDLPVLAGLREDDRLKTGADTFDILEVAVADTEERIGVAVANEDEPLRQLLRYFLDRWQKQGEGSPWLVAYDRTLGQLRLDAKYRSQPYVESPPDLADNDSKGVRK